MARLKTGLAGFRPFPNGLAVESKASLDAEWQGVSVYRFRPDRGIPGSVRCVSAGTVRVCGGGCQS